MSFGINICFFADRKALSYKWNVIMAFYYPFHDLQLSEAEIASVKRNARIVHFNGKARPWSYHSRHPHKPTYYFYLAQTEWRNFTPADRTLKDVARKHLWPIIPGVVKRILRPLLGI